MIPKSCDGQTGRRRELARSYLLQPALELSEIACLLGYEDPNSFFRAFREWEGTTPGEWRRRGSPTNHNTEGLAQRSQRTQR